MRPTGPIPVASRRPRPSARLTVCGIRLGALFGTARPGRRGPSPATSGAAHSCVLDLLGPRPGGPIPVTSRRPRPSARLTAAFLGLLAVSVGAGVAAAQGPAKAQPAKAQPAKAKAPAKAQAPALPAAGSWASYRWTSTIRQTVPVLVQQTGAGGQVVWSVAQESALAPSLLVTFALVRSDRRTYTLQIVTQDQPDGVPLSITHITVDRASGKAVRSLIRYPKGVVATPESGLRPFREAAVAQGQRADVMVPAGSFSAVHGTAQGADAWVSDAVPAFGLVKGVWPDGMLELVSSAATGAKDLLRAPAR